MNGADGADVSQIRRAYSRLPARSWASAKASNAASYGFSVSLPDKYLWMTLDRSVW